MLCPSGRTCAAFKKVSPLNPVQDKILALAAAYPGQARQREQMGQLGYAARTGQVEQPFLAIELVFVSGEYAFI